MIPSCCSPAPGLNQLILLSVPVKLKDYQSAILNFERALEKARLLPSEAAQNGIIAVRGMEEELWATSGREAVIPAGIIQPVMPQKCSLIVGKNLVMIAEGFGNDSKRKQENVGYVAAFLGLLSRTSSLSGLG